MMTESTIEEATLSWLQELGFAILHGRSDGLKGDRNRR